MDTPILFMFATLVLVLLFMSFFLWLGWVWYIKKTCTSPYTGHALRRCTQLHYTARHKVIQYLKVQESWDNPVFNLKWASYCRELGRIFPNSVNWWSKIDVKWDFLTKRYEGNFVSWGSLSPDQQNMIKNYHESLDGFQTDQSSPESAPRKIEAEYAYLKPGPLYVDIDTKVLLGWKSVPDSELEILVVQKPIKKI